MSEHNFSRRMGGHGTDQRRCSGAWGGWCIDVRIGILSDPCFIGVELFNRIVFADE